VLPIQSLAFPHKGPTSIADPLISVAAITDIKPISNAELCAARSLSHDMTAVLSAVPPAGYTSRTAMASLSEVRLD